MKFIASASSSSAWRGYEYYLAKKVLEIKSSTDNQFKGKVSGSDNKHYDVFIDIDRPRSSTCNCPHAKDRLVICKHKVALYFFVYPEDAVKYLKEVEKAEKEYEEYEKELYKRVEKHIKFKMTKSELQNSLYHILNIAPEWIYDEFVRDNVGY